MSNHEPSDAKNPLPAARAGFRGFDLNAYLKPPRVGFDAYPILDLLAIALLFSLLFSRMVMTPGVRLDLPETTLRMSPATSAVAVLTVQNEGMLLFDGGVYQVETISDAFEEYIMEKKEGPIILLLKAGERFSLASLLNISGMAQEAGFSQVHLTAKRPESKSEGLEPNEMESMSEYDFLSP